MLLLVLGQLWRYLGELVDWQLLHEFFECFQLFVVLESVHLSEQRVTLERDLVLEVDDTVVLVEVKLVDKDTVLVDKQVELVDKNMVDKQVELVELVDKNMVLVDKQVELVDKDTVLVDKQMGPEDIDLLVLVDLVADFDLLTSILPGEFDVV